MENKVTLVLNIEKHNKHIDLEVPIDITANDLVLALNSAYELGIDITDAKKCFLKSENPIALLRGGKVLKEYGIRNGTIINFTE